MTWFIAIFLMTSATYAAHMEASIQTNNFLRYEINTSALTRQERIAAYEMVYGEDDADDTYGKHLRNPTAARKMILCELGKFMKDKENKKAEIDACNKILKLFPR